MPNIELICAELSSIEARVVASLLRPDARDWRLVGEIRGPQCKFAKTLAATIRFHVTSDAANISASATVPDPCFWTPEVPMLYHARLDLTCEGKVVQTLERPLALRPLTARGSDLFYAGRRWVLRGVSRGTSPDAPLEDWRAAGAAMLIDELDKATASAAAELGVLLVVRVGEQAPDQIAAELRRLARMPAVAIVALQVGAVLPRDVRAAVPNLRIAAECRPDIDESQLPGWADLLLCDCAEPQGIASLAGRCGRPIVALRSEGQSADVATGRAACDELQRDLAPQADLAGYIV
ncbi:MAG: hypothetical protein K8T25_00150 [Planctomycetia bacterium]|nr:hypothetical protein [Planctomycetia bacterium]